VIGITTGEVSGDEIQSLGGLVVRFSSTLQWLDASDSDNSPYIISPGEQLNMRLNSAREGSSTIYTLQNNEITLGSEGTFFASWFLNSSNKDLHQYRSSLVLRKISDGSETVYDSSRQAVLHDVAVGDKVCVRIECTSSSVVTMDPRQSSLVIHNLGGDKGDPGPKGDQGEPGIGLAGPRGVSGPLGQTGNTGTSGPSGSTGPSGLRGPSGDIGPVGFGASGPRGISGPFGVMGGILYDIRRVGATTLLNNAEAPESLSLLRGHLYAFRSDEPLSIVKDAQPFVNSVVYRSLYDRRIYHLPTGSTEPVYNPDTVTSGVLFFQIPDFEQVDIVSGDIWAVEGTFPTPEAFHLEQGSHELSWAGASSEAGSLVFWASAALTLDLGFAEFIYDNEEAALSCQSWKRSDAHHCGSHRRPGAHGWPGVGSRLGRVLRGSGAAPERPQTTPDLPEHRLHPGGCVKGPQLLRFPDGG
jgi:hypothetical protein